MAASRNEKLALLVDPEEESRHVYSSWLLTRGFETVMTPRGRVALWLLQRYQPAFILTQEQLRDMSALDLLHRLRSRSSTARLPFIVLCKSFGRQQEFWLAGAAAVVPSLGFDDLRGVLQTALSQVNRYAN
jgi:CheY-like chemotaxis protein